MATVTMSNPQAARFLIIGAGARGRCYARAIKASTKGIVVGVSEIDEYKRNAFCNVYDIANNMAFTDWRELVTESGQQRLKNGGGVDGVLICTLDHMHVEIAITIIPFGYHVLCEKPLATTYDDCLAIQKAVKKQGILLAVGHVLRYSPHNLLLKRLVCDEKIVGEIVAVEHTEPVGWYHFAHSYVRGNWHKEATSAPSILTKCCHDLDLLLWLLCSPTPLNPADITTSPHLPSTVYSTGSLTHFRPAHKPSHATNNCMTCPVSVERACLYSANKIYIESPSTGLVGAHNQYWPVDIVYPEVKNNTIPFAAKQAELLKRLATGPYGRCVYDGHNDVVDNQVVLMSWNEDPLLPNRGPKTATLTMTAFTHATCQRRTRIYGTLGEIHSDTSLPPAASTPRNERYVEPNTSLKSISFGTAKAQWVTHTPSSVDLMSGHGGGDTGLARAFVEAVESVKINGWDVQRAQREILGGGVDEAVRAHGMAFAAEESRKGNRVVNWNEWDNAQRKQMQDRR